MRTVKIIENVPSSYVKYQNVVFGKSDPEFMKDRKTKLVEEIKNVVSDMVQYSNKRIKTNFSDYLSEKLNYQYAHLAKIFSKEQGTTIENFIIVQKIEKVKKFLVSDKYSLTEIATKLHYSSVGHLSGQFKKVTGLTPSNYQAIQKQRVSRIKNYYDSVMHS